MRIFQGFFVFLTIISVSYVLYNWYSRNTYEYQLSSIIDSITQFENQYLERDTPVFFEVEKLKKKLNYLLTYNKDFKELPIFNETLAELSVVLMEDTDDLFVKSMKKNYPSLRIGYVYNCGTKDVPDVCSYESRLLKEREMSPEEKRFWLKKISYELNKEAFEYLKEKNLDEIREIINILKSRRIN